MSLSEFDVIHRYFTDISPKRADVVLGIGDDCSLLNIPLNHQLAVSIDTLVSGRHFYPDVDPYTLGYKALAVNLSDLAAMGAIPAWVTLALTLPEVNEAWLAGFSKGFSELAHQYGIQLIGGDTTSGPLSISIQVHGFIPNGEALCRSGAKAGDLIFVSGTLGDAAYALDHKLKSKQLEQPEPRVALGLALRGLATSAIDVSDGLLADLHHICHASHVAAVISYEKIPLSSALKKNMTTSSDWDYCLSGGDDYELCFTLPSSEQDKINKTSHDLNLALTCIGEIKDGSGIKLKSEDGSYKVVEKQGYDHFKKANK